MIDHSPHESLKGEALHLWNSNRPLAVTILVGFVVLAWYLYKKGQGGLTMPDGSASGVPTAVSNTYVTANKTINVASPSPVVPVPTNPVVPGTQGPVSGPTATGQPIIGNPIAQPGRITPIIPYNSLPPGTRYSTAADLKAQPTLTWMGVTYKKIPGSHGFLWGQPVTGGQQVLLYGPPSAY